ncbi:hypothetical protein GE061_009393 [Apolygus lucorum]|uniref:CD109 antigen n=1 Tax=Apolygus lucorum TaxID=248454 RepID=A0A8S9Y010_APOLU|nr:hypothetical protein GE061_009393 [Apolygus lucorum]
MPLERPLQSRGRLHSSISSPVASYIPTIPVQSRRDLMMRRPLLLTALFTIVAAPPPCHVITGGRSVRPGQLYVVAVHLCSEGELKMTSSILRSGVVVTSATLDISSGAVAQIPLKVPTGITSGNYKLVVEGALKGTNKYFYNSTSLEFKPKLAAIIIQTSRPIYRASQIVYFRVLALQTDLKAYDDSLDVYIIDSDGFIMRRWLSVVTNNGILSMKYKLPEYVKEGVWKIRVKTYSQVEEQNIKVENYFDPLFEVFVELPAYAGSGDEELTAIVKGMMTTQEIVRGNLTMRLLLTKNHQDAPQLLWERRLFAHGPVEQRINVSDIDGEGGELKLEAEMTDMLYGSSSKGYSVTRIVPDRLRIRFVCDGIITFRLAKPIVLSIAVESESGQAVVPGTIEKSLLRVEVESTTRDGIVEKMEPIELFPIDLLNQANDLFFIDSDALENFPRTGVITVTLRPPPSVEYLRIRAILKVDGTEIDASALCAAVSSPDGNIALYASSLYPQVDEYAVLHLTADVPIHSFQYLVISKDNIVNGGEVSLPAGLRPTASFSVAMGPDMAPGFHVVAYASHNGTLLADSIFLPVNGFNRYEMALTMNNGKDLRGDNVEIIVSGDEGAYIVVSSARENFSHKIQAGNEMSLSRVLNSLMSFDHYYKRLPRVSRRWANGEMPEETQYFPNSGSGRSPRRTFALASLVLFTDMISAPTSESCEDPDLYYCNGGGCYNETQKCNGVPDCIDSTDEQNCEILQDDDYEFAISRLSRSVFLFDADDGDWAWREIKKNDHTGDEYDPIEVPKVAENWVINAFSVSPKVGFSILESPIQYSSKRGLSARLSGPPSCRRGEQLGLRLVIHNNDPARTLVLVQVIASPSHKVVQVGSAGFVSSYSASLVGGHLQILIYVRGESQERLDLPVVPTVEQGEVEIQVIASSQAGRESMTHVLQVLPEGAEVKRHLSSVLDLRSRAFVLSYLDIPVEETPIVPYQVWRRYVFGSPTCSISVTGNLLGPLLEPDGISLVTTLDRHAKGTDVRLYEFGMSIWTLHYRRLMSTVENSREVRERLEHANLLYGNIMKRYNDAGYFVNWDSAHPSVWLTAWVLRVLKGAVYGDWEYVLYVDKRVVEAAVSWILGFQTPEGKFVETEYYINTPLDSRTSDHTPDSRVAMTAHVLIALNECSVLVEGHTRNRVVESILSGIKYLEAKLNIIVDTRVLAIAVWALNLGKSDRLQTAMNLLINRTRTNTDGLPYWSPVEIPSPPLKKENQRLFRGARLYTEGDSAAVEATSYALLALMAQEGVSPTTDNIVLWLQTMRMSNDGFISMMDTLMAVQALTEYANRARLVDVTHMDVRLTSPSDPSVDHLLHIRNRSDISLSHVIQMKRVWGHVNVIGRGAGLALVQLHISYGVDVVSLLDAPSTKSFGLTIREFYSSDRNKSAITIEACTKWLNDWPPSSGSAVLEVDVPTGYFLVESEAEQIIRKNAHPSLRDAKTLHHKTVWLFDHIPNSWNCFNHTVRRWFAVANMTLYRGAILYEANARENFVQVLFNSTPLYTLSICEVCGSYQCPYCPYYNSAQQIRFSIDHLGAIFLSLYLLRHNKFVL